jgi:catechol 2,3-dioxygenase-like lactoylglutathione lyase family enzyme
MSTRFFSSFFAALTLLAISVPAYAQQPRVVGTSMLHLNTVSVDQSLAFYRDVLGMEMFNSTPFRDGANLGGAPGGKLKTAQLRVPGGDFQLELIEWTDTKLNPQHLRIQDPGEIMLAISVRDFKTKLEAAKKLGLKVITKNGEVETSGNQPAIMLADPTGFIVELNDLDGAKKPVENAWPGPIGNVGIFLTVEDLAKTVAFYNHVFGFSVPEPAAAKPSSPRHQTLFNQKFTTERSARGSFPAGMKFPPITFQEFGGVDRKTVHHGVMDPGGPILPLTVTDFPAAIADVKAYGGIIGFGDKSETLAADARASWIRDPNGFLFRLAMSAPPRTATK